MSMKHTKTKVVCCSCIHFTTKLAKPILCYSNFNIIPLKPAWIWYDFCQILMIKIIQKNHAVISLKLRFLKNFEIFLMMKIIENIVSGRYLWLPVQFSSKSENFCYGFKMIVFYHSFLTWHLSRNGVVMFKLL